MTTVEEYTTFYGLKEERPLGFQYKDIIVMCFTCNKEILVEECNVSFLGNILHMRCLPAKRPNWIINSCKHSLNCVDRPENRTMETPRNNRKDKDLIKI